MSPEAIRAELKQLADKPDSAFVAVQVAAAHDGVSEKTVRRDYPLIQLTERRKGVRLGFLRHRQAQAVT
jgi:hypothetical protein